MKRLRQKAPSGLSYKVSGYIDADNTASLGLHEKFGFVRVGLLPGVAYRFGRWCDTVMVQRSLGLGATEPPSPTVRIACRIGDLSLSEASFD